MRDIKKVVALVNSLGCKPRVKLKHTDLPEAWGNMGVVLPVRGYIEVIGPWPFREVEWLEINPIVMEHIGRLIKPKQHNYLNDIVTLLQLEGVPYSVIEGMLRVPFEVFE